MDMRNKNKIETILVNNYHVVKDKVGRINSEVKSNLLTFDNEYDNAFGEVKELKEHNSLFSNNYKLHEKRKEEKRKKMKHYEVPFKDLIRRYNEKKYRIPNLSVKDNLFEPSPLLLENKEIRDFYKYMTIEDNECKFLEKVNSEVLDRMNSIDFAPMVRRRSELSRRVSLRTKQPGVESVGDLRDEYKKLKKEVNRAYETIDHEARHPYDEKYDFELLDRKTRKKSTSSVNHTIEALNRTPSQAFSTNYGSFCFTPRSKVIGPGGLSSARLDSKYEDKSKPSDNSITPVTFKSIKSMGPNKTDSVRNVINNLNQKRPSRNTMPQYKLNKFVINKKLDHDSVAKFENNQHGFIEFIYNKTKENDHDEYETEKMLKTYYKTFHKCDEEEIKNLFHNKKNEPVNLMETIADYKKKIDKCNVGEILKSTKLVSQDDSNKSFVKHNLRKIR
jgi:hypothetical protein